MGSQRVRHNWVTELNWKLPFKTFWSVSHLPSPIYGIESLNNRVWQGLQWTKCFFRNWISSSGSLNLSHWYNGSVQFSSVAQSCPTFWDPMNHSTPGLPVHHQLPEFTQTHIHRVSDAIQPPHPLSSPSPPASNASQHQSLFQWVNSSHEVDKVLELQF